MAVVNHLPDLPPPLPRVPSASQRMQELAGAQDFSCWVSKAKKRVPLPPELFPCRCLRSATQASLFPAWGQSSILCSGAGPAQSLAEQLHPCCTTSPLCPLHHCYPSWDVGAGPCLVHQVNKHTELGPTGRSLFNSVQNQMLAF